MKKGKSVEALRSVSFSFPETGIVFIVGKSGSGKSTMLNILGLLDKYDSGEYLIDGKCSTALSEVERDAFRALNIGFVFQEFHIIEKYTIGQNISLPLEIQQNENNDEKVKEILTRVGLEDYENRNPAEISGGQKQRVAIARAIIKEPKIILADEPTGSLDSVTGSEIFNILQRLSKEKLVIVISHDIESAHKYADKIIELKDGQIDNVYDGDGGAEAVKFVVNEITADKVKEYNKVLNEGKKIVITKTKPAKQIVEQPRKETCATENKKVKLPFKSMLKLSFFSVKSKWVRTFFTVLIAMFAIAFFGFADIVSRFDANNLIIQELNRDDSGYVNIGMEKTIDYGIFQEYSATEFQTPQIEKFKNLNLEAYPRRPFVLFPYYLPHGKFQDLLPTKDKGQYYEPYFINYTECSDVSRLGLNIVAGREPQNFNEILINTYHMQCMEAFGFSNSEVFYSSVTDFEQIKGQSIYYGSGFCEYYTFTIVGLIDIDLSEYQELANIKTKVNTLTKDQELLLDEFRNNYFDINNIFVKEGFFEDFEAQTAGRRLHNAQFLYDTNTHDMSWGIERITNEIFSNSAIVLHERINNFEDIGNDKIVMSVPLMKKLVPESANFEGTAVEYCDAYNILGSKISITAEIAATAWTMVGTFEREVEIIGVYAFEEVAYISQNIVNEMRTDFIHLYKVPASNNAERTNIVETISNAGIFSIGEDSFRFFCSTKSYHEIKQVDTYFVLFVNVFSILAIVFCIFAVILTYTFISQSIALRKKDIGILRSLGARKKDVAGIFVIEGIFIAILEILLGTLTCYAGYKLLDYYFINKLGTIAELYNIVSFAPRQVLLVAVTTIIAVAVSLFIPIYKISKKQPVDAIRN